VYLNIILFYTLLILYFIISRSKSEVGHKSPQATRFTLDEKFMVDLEAEVITKPQLVLLPYNWPTEDNKINFGKMTQDQTKCVILLFYFSRYLLEYFIYSLDYWKICRQPNHV
jgi:hypothetical protein